MENIISSCSVNASPGARVSRRDVFISLAVILLSFLIYNANLRVIGAIDTYPARYLPFTIVHDHTLFMEKVADVALQGNSPEHYVIQNRKGRTISFYPVVTPIVVAPLYIPAVAWLNKAGWTKQRLDFIARLMEKASASLMASVTAGMMFLLMRRRLGISNSLLLTIAFAFGTNSWMIGSQAFWQHGTAELLITGCLLLVTGPFTAVRGCMLGLLCGLVAFNRPPDALFAGAFMAYGFWWAGRRIPWIIAGAATSTLPIATYNILAAHHIAGAYAFTSDRTFFNFSILPGIAGLFFSPGRGLFIFTPFLLFLLFGAKWVWNEFRRQPLGICLCTAVLLQVLMYAKSDWRSGWSWGPRYLTDMLPILVWMLIPVVSGLRRVSRTVFIALTGASIAIQAIGAFWYNSSSDAIITAVAWGPDRSNAAWDIRNTPFIYELRHPMAHRNLLLGNIRGNIDRISIDDRVVTETSPGPELTIEEWALARDRPGFARCGVFPPGYPCKGNTVFCSITHLAGGLLHFLLGYSVFSPIGLKAVFIASFFALVFTAGHATQEVQDYEDDRANGIHTNANVFGKASVFVAALLCFAFAYGDLAWLSLSGLLPRSLW